MTVKEMIEFLYHIEQDVQIFLGGDMGLSPLTRDNIELSEESSHFIVPPKNISETIIIIGERR